MHACTQASLSMVCAYVGLHVHVRVRMGGRGGSAPSPPPCHPQHPTCCLIGCAWDPPHPHPPTPAHTCTSGPSPASSAAPSATSLRSRSRGSTLRAVAWWSARSHCREGRGGEGARGEGVGGRLAEMGWGLWALVTPGAHCVAHIQGGAGSAHVWSTRGRAQAGRVTVDAPAGQCQGLCSRVGCPAAQHATSLDATDATGAPPRTCKATSTALWSAAWKLSMEASGLPPACGPPCSCCTARSSSSWRGGVGQHGAWLVSADACSMAHAVMQARRPLSSGGTP